MMFINNYCTDFMFQEVMVCVTCSPSTCLQVLITKFIHKFQQNELYLENKKEIRNYERHYCTLYCYAYHDL